MSLYLLRHAEAVSEADDLSDESRFLTVRGRDTARRLGATLASLGIVPTAIVSSPLVRAVQTAEIVRHAAGFDATLAIHEGLAPGRSVGRFVGELAALEGALLVGHEPSLSRLAASITGAIAFPGFDKAEAVCVDRGAVVWRLLPSDSAPRISAT